MPFRFGLCNGGGGWRLFERVADGLRWVTDWAWPVPVAARPGWRGVVWAGRDGQPSKRLKQA